MFFYGAGALAAEGNAAGAYDPRQLTQAARLLLGWNTVPLHWAYPPTLLLPLALLGTLPPGWALTVWVTVLAGSSLWVAASALGSWRLAPVALLFPGTALALYGGQLTPLLALLLVWAMPWREAVGLRSSVALGLLSWKPHFAPVPVVVALVRRRYRQVLVGCATGAALVLASVVAYGPDPWWRFLAEGAHHWQMILTRTAPTSRLVSVFGTVFTFGGSVHAALAAHAVAAGLASCLCISLMRHAGRASLRALGLVGLTLSVTPYAFDYDLAFLLIPWALMIREAGRGGTVTSPQFWLWVYLTCIAPVSWLINLYTGRAVGGPLLLGILWLGWWSARGPGSEPPRSALAESPSGL